MADFKGTKGAWRFSEEYMEITASRIGILEGSKSICAINKFPEFDYSGQTAKANALLISKAPEMLQMLKVLVKVLKTINIFGATKRIIEKAEQLIKQATEI